MTVSPYVEIARVIKTHGLAGEVSVAPAAEASLALLTGTEIWFVPPCASARSSRIVSVRPGPKGPLALLEGIESIDQARLLVGSRILARAEDVPDGWFDEEEFSFVGFRVSDEVHGDLGEVVDVIVTGANDVLVLKGPLGEVLVPVIDDVVLVIDEDAARLSVRLLPGLLPGEGEEA